MSRAAALALAAALGAVPMLSGCIAAAIPLAAGAALAKSRLDQDRTAPASPQGVAAASPAGVPELASASARSDLKIEPTGLTSLPPPDGAMFSDAPSYAALEAYALAQAAIQPGMGKRVSALVSSPGDLMARRADCTASTPAVFIDLDPGRGTFDPLAPGRASPALASTLADLRAQGINVVWFSRLGENFSGAVRAALARGGLDPSGSDRIVLMRGIDERKQTRRDNLASLVCPIALVGDERADFDELYLYLKRPDAAVALDALIGRGWFLVSPFRPDPTLFSGAKP